MFPSQPFLRRRSRRAVQLTNHGQRPALRARQSMEDCSIGRGEMRADDTRNNCSRRHAVSPAFRRFAELDAPRCSVRATRIKCMIAKDWFDQPQGISHRLSFETFEHINDVRRHSTPDIGFVHSFRIVAQNKRKVSRRQTLLLPALDQGLK